MSKKCLKVFFEILQHCIKCLQHYKQFLEAITEWKEKVKDAESLGEETPPVTDYIGECFLKIAQHLSFRPNFINYSYKEEMIGDGIENCLQYVNNFDPEKSKKPFSYFTQIMSPSAYKFSSKCQNVSNVILPFLLSSMTNVSSMCKWWQLPPTKE